MEAQFWISMGALLVASLALYINGREHREFMRQLRARARFRLTVRTLDADDDGVMRTDGSALWPRVEIGLRNEGDRAATWTTLNVVVPRQLANFRWCGPHGEELPELAGRGPADTSEELVDADGKAHEGKWIALELPRVKRRTSYARWITFYSTLGDTPISVPVRVKAGADELPDDTDEVAEEHMVRIEPIRPAR